MPANCLRERRFVKARVLSRPQRQDEQHPEQDVRQQDGFDDQGGVGVGVYGYTFKASRGPISGVKESACVSFRDRQFVPVLDPLTISTASPPAARQARSVECRASTKSPAGIPLRSNTPGRGFFYRRFRNERQSPIPELRHAAIRFVYRMEHGKRPKTADLLVLLQFGAITPAEAQPGGANHNRTESARVASRNRIMANGT